MGAMKRYGPRRRGATLADVLAATAATALLAALVGLRPAQINTDPTSQGLLSVVSVSRQATCQANLQKLGVAEFMVMGDHAGYATRHSDGEIVEFSWVELLYDLGYLRSLDVEICPADARPDPAVAQRGEDWGFSFVQEFGVGEPNKPGVRTSYGLNMMLSYNYRSDRFADTSRQILAADGQWTWLGNLNARWQMQGYVGQNKRASLYPNWQPTATWRHGAAQQADIVFMDGSVRPITPRVPQTLDDLSHTVDTTEAFTWLPDEREDRLDIDRYGGGIAEYLGREPYDGNFWWQAPYIPFELQPRLRTETRSWVRLPSDPEDRR